MNIQVSVIIINYNTFKLTRECIASVIKYTRGVRYEIILIDNASSECDPSLFKKEFPSIHLICCETNGGFSKANNLGVAAAKGEQVLLLNSDTYLQDDSIAALYVETNNRPEVAVSSGKLVFPDGRIQGNCGRFPSIGVFLFEFTRLQKLWPKDKRGRILLSSFFDYDTEVYPDWVWGTFMMIRKALIQKLPGGKLNDDYFMYGEDMQWCLDFTRLGYRVLYVPTAHVVHLMGGSSANKLKLNSANINRLIDANYPAIKAVILKKIYQYYF